MAAIAGRWSGGTICGSHGWSWIAIIGPPGPTVGGTSLRVTGPPTRPLPGQHPRKRAVVQEMLTI